MTTSILQSFSLPLPNPLRENPGGPTHLRGSSALVDPPKVALPASVNTWIELSQEVLRNVRQSIATKPLAHWESTRILRTEGDVAAAASPQLMNPVDLALESHHGTPILGVHQYDLSRACADRVWLANLTATQRAPFAVLDYKRVGTILGSEFATALAAGNRALQTQRFPDETRFKGNSNKLLKIATNYAATYSTRYIAFFDWDILLLIVMEDIDMSAADGGNWCKVTLVQEKSQIRPALLGFLEGAYRSTLKGNNNHLPPYRQAVTVQEARKSQRSKQTPASYNEDNYTEEERGDTYDGHYTTHRGSHSLRPSQAQYAFRGADRSYSYLGDDLDMGRLSLTGTRREGTPRSGSHDSRYSSQSSYRNKESGCPPNLHTPLSEKSRYSGYEERYSRR